jgi:serine/threonine-protein kinase
MGAVYEAVHVGLGVRVAVKLLNPSFTSNEKAVSRFKREARTAAAVRHENIVTVTDTDLDDEGVPFIVMELLEGESLNSLIRRERSLRAEVSSAIAAQVLEGLAAAHERGVIHRDLKPGNVVLARERSGAYRVKILDFGISKFVADELKTHDVTATGAVIGTPRFMAPEQARGQTDLDARVDLYAVGLMMYTMLTGKLPFSGASPEEITSHITSGNFMPPRQVRPDIPEALERVILKAMATDRDDRYPDARTFLNALKEAVPLLAQEIELHAPPTGATQTPPRRTSGPISVQVPIVPVAMNPSVEGEAATNIQTVAASPKAMTPPPRSGSRLAIRFVGLSVLLLLGVASFAVWRYWLGPRLVAKNPETPAVIGPEVTASTLRFGITRYLPEKEVREAYQPFVEHLGKKLNRPTELVVVEDYLDLAEALLGGQVDMGALSAYSYVRAKRQAPNLKILAKPVAAGGPTYEGVIIVRADSGIETIADLKDKLFCYVTPNSTSGYLYPRAIFRRAGMDPDKAFSATRFTGDHLASLKALQTRKCDGAVVFSAALFDAKAKGIPPETFRILASTDRIPYDAYCVLDSMDPKLADDIQKALLELEPGSPVAMELFKVHGQITGFMKAQDSDYDGVRAIEKYLDEPAQPGP